MSRCYKTVKQCLQKAQTIKEYRVYKTVINCKDRAGHRHVARCKKGSGTRRERTIIFESKTGIHNLEFGCSFVKYKYVRDVLSMQMTLPFEVMLLSTGKGQDRGKYR